VIKGVGERRAGKEMRSEEEDEERGIFGGPRLASARPGTEILNGERRMLGVSLHVGRKREDVHTKWLVRPCGRDLHGKASTTGWAGKKKSRLPESNKKFRFNEEAS